MTIKQTADFIKHIFTPALCRKDDRQGFTIVEVLVATTILIIAVIGTSAFFFSNRANIVSARRERQATWTAVEKMEELKSRNYSYLEGLLENGSYTLTETGIDVNGISGERVVTITKINEGPVSMLHLEVEIIYGDHLVSLDTYITDMN